jgi:hypothetical protein
VPACSWRNRWPTKHRRFPGCAPASTSTWSTPPSRALRLDLTDAEGAHANLAATGIPITLGVNAQNDAPLFAVPAMASFAENSTGIAYRATAADPEGSAVSFSIPGTDAALFRIHAATGAVRFRDPPDFEAPQDSGLNGVYDLTVTASEGALSTALNVAITVTNVNGRASFGGLADSVTFAASSLAVAPRVLDGDVSFSAPDGTHAGRTLTVSGLLAGDQLGFAAIGGISVAGSSVLYTGTAFATLSIGPGSGPSRSASTSRSSRWPPPSP